MLKKTAAASVAVSIAFIACGLILLFNPASAARVVLRAAGIVAIISGIMRVVNIYNARSASAMVSKNEIVSAVAMLAVGFVLTFFTRGVLGMVSVAVGIIMAAAGVLMFSSAVSSPARGAFSWWITLLISCAGVVLGVIILFGGISPVNVILRVAGAALAVWGVQGLIAQRA